MGWSVGSRRVRWGRSLVHVVVAVLVETTAGRAERRKRRRERDRDRYIEREREKERLTKALIPIIRFVPTVRLAGLAAIAVLITAVKVLVLVVVLVVVVLLLVPDYGIGLEGSLTPVRIIVRALALARRVVRRIVLV